MQTVVNTRVVFAPASLLFCLQWSTTNIIEHHRFGLPKINEGQLAKSRLDFGSMKAVKFSADDVFVRIPTQMYNLHW